MPRMGLSHEPSSAGDLAKSQNGRTPDSGDPRWRSARLFLHDPEGGSVWLQPQPHWSSVAQACWPQFSSRPGSLLIRCLLGWPDWRIKGLEVGLEVEGGAQPSVLCVSHSPAPEQMAIQHRSIVEPVLIGDAFVSVIRDELSCGASFGAAQKRKA